jgi:hypothetical protein
VTNGLDACIHRDEKPIVRCGDERVMEREVPCLELLAALRRRTSAEAPVHLLEVPRRGTRDDERKDLRLEQLAGGHHVGRAHIIGPLFSGIGSERRCRAQERSATDLSRDPPLGLEHAEGMPDSRAGDLERLGELALGRKASTRGRTGAFALAEYERRKGATTGRSCALRKCGDPGHAGDEIQPILARALRLSPMGARICRDLTRWAEMAMLAQSGHNNPIVNQ